MKILLKIKFMARTSDNKPALEYAGIRGSSNLAKRPPDPVDWPFNTASLHNTLRSKALANIEMPTRQAYLFKITEMILKMCHIRFGQ